MTSSIKFNNYSEKNVYVCILENPKRHANKRTRKFLPKTVTSELVLKGKSAEFDVEGNEHRVIVQEVISQKNIKKPPKVLEFSNEGDIFVVPEPNDDGKLKDLEAKVKQLEDENKKLREKVNSASSSKKAEDAPPPKRPEKDQATESPPKKQAEKKRVSDSPPKKQAEKRRMEDKKKPTVVKPLEEKKRVSLKTVKEKEKVKDPPILKAVILTKKKTTKTATKASGPTTGGGGSSPKKKEGASSASQKKKEPSPATPTSSTPSPIGKKKKTSDPGKMAKSIKAEAAKKPQSTPVEKGSADEKEEEEPEKDRQQLSLPTNDEEKAACEELIMLVKNGRESDASGILKEGKCKLDYQDRSGITALMWSAIYDKGRLSKLLLDYGASTRVRGSNDDQAIHLACKWGHITIAQCLIDAGVNVNVRGAKRKTPLHFAAQSGNYQLVRLLLENGGRRNLRDQDGKKPSDYAKSYAINRDLTI